MTVRIPEATRMLGISRSRVYELITSGDIEVIKLGRSTLVPVAGLHALVQRLREEQLG
ncbi:helix-turn-helix domain-containing protein [Sphingomonas sp. AOB5]|nr:helix-turn-helix domain-containing protein [Sphingomonas sp. AOB5]MDF7773769.1 helix-turn-helix domain-containing protein [Sphingomonas sp. AOB5]